MFLKIISLSLAAIFLTNPSVAETFEVQMLNKGETGALVFEPSYLKVAVGDTITFLPASKGHNAVTIKGMFPENVEKFKSKIGKPFSVTLTVEGLYGIKCTPHYAIGMVALIQVGTAINLDEALTVKHKGKATARFETLFEKVN